MFKYPTIKKRKQGARFGLQRFMAGLVLAMIAVPLLATLVFASVISDAQYMGTILVTNNSTSATNVSVNCTINTQALIDAGYINDTCNNTAIRDSGGSDVAYMPACGDNTIWSLFVSSIGVTTSQNYYLYAGGTTDMAAKIRYFPGTGGMTTTDSANLELSDNFTIEQKGWVDTSAPATTSNVTVYFRTRPLETAGTNYARPYLRLNATNTVGTYVSDDNATYTSHNETLARPGGGSWAYDDLVDLQAGIGLTADASYQSMCTQIYVVVSYDDGSSEILRPNGSGNLTNIEFVDGAATHWQAVDEVTADDDTTRVRQQTQPGEFIDTYDLSDPILGGYNLVYKHDAFRTYRSGTGNITSQIMGTSANVTATGVSSGEHTVKTEYQASLLLNGDFEIGDPPDDWTLGGANATVSRSSAQAKIGTYSALVTRNGTNCWIEQDPSNYALYKGKTLTLGCWVYATVADRAFLELTDSIDWSASSYHSGVAGWEWITVTHTVNPGTTLVRCRLRISTGDTSAYFDGIVLVVNDTILEGGNFILTIDDTKFLGIVSDNISVPGNFNDWTFLQNDVMPYMESHKITVSGTLQQHIVWENDASTFSDQSGNGHDTTPTFRTDSSDADVSATLLSFEPISEAKAPAYAVGTPPPFISETPTVPAGFQAGEIDSDVVGSDVIEEVAREGNTPNQLLYGSLMGFFIIAVNLTLAWALHKSASTKSALVKVLVTFVLIGVFMASGIADLWMLIMYGIIAVALAMGSRQLAW